MAVIDRIADFMGSLLAEIRHSGRRQDDMAATLASIKDKVTKQGEDIDALVKAKSTAEQADLDAIDAAIDANGEKITAALTPTAGTTAPAPVSIDPTTGLPVTG